VNSLGTTLIFATHNKSIVDRLKRRVILMKAGKIVSDRIKGGYAI